MIAGTPAPTVLEGKWDGSWAAILRFPSMEMAQAWYNSAVRIPAIADSDSILMADTVPR